MSERFPELNAERKRETDRRSRAQDVIGKNVNIELEARILGAIINHGDRALTHLGDLEVQDFFNPKHQAIFTAVRNLEAARTPIDVATLDVELQRMGRDKAVESPAYLGTIMLDHVGMAPSTVAYYVDDLRSLRTSREVALAADRILTWAGDAGTRGNELIDEAMGELSRVTTPMKAHEEVTIATIAVKQVERIVAWDSATDAQREAMLPRIPWGIPSLDAETGGGPCGLVTVVGARPGVGKTTLMVNMALRTSEPGIVFTNEDDPDEDLGAVMLAWRARVDSRRIHDMTLTPIERASVIQAAEWLEAKNHVRFVRAAGMNIHQMKRIAATDQQRRGTRWMWVDYLQNMPASPGARSKDGKRTYEIQEIMQTGQTFAADTGMMVAFNSQISRDAAKEFRPGEGGKPPKPSRPSMHHFRDSGAIEACGKLILALHRDPDKPNNTIEVIVLKNRRGAAQTNRGPRVVDLECLYEFGYLGDAPIQYTAASPTRFDNTPHPSEYGQ